MARRTVKAPTFKVGDKVRLLRTTRHGMIEVGAVGVVTEVRDSGHEFARGVCVNFMKKPDPRIAAIFGKDPNVAEPFGCLFPFTSVARQIALA